MPNNKSPVSLDPTDTPLYKMAQYPMAYLIEYQKMKDILRRLIKWDEFVATSESMEPDDVLSDIVDDARKILQKTNQKEACTWTKQYTTQFNT